MSDYVKSFPSEAAVLLLEAKGAAWDALSSTLVANANGHCSAADVCAVGFSLQEKVGAAEDRGRVEPLARRLRELGSREVILFAEGDAEGIATGRVGAIKAGGVLVKGLFYPWSSIARVQVADEEEEHG